MTVEQLVAGFDISRLTKSNSLFDRQKLIAFNTEHLRMTPREKVVKYFRDFLNENQSPVAKADDKMLAKLLELCSGARTLSDVEKKSRFLFVDDDKIEYDDKAVKKVLQSEGQAFLKVISERLKAMDSINRAGNRADASGPRRRKRRRPRQGRPAFASSSLRVDGEPVYV